jgi:long-chain fatty acid transport protein
MGIRHFIAFAGLLTPLVCAATGQVFAAGYQLNEQDATQVGLSLAGNAIEHAPAVQASNPAGLANLTGTQLQVGSNLYFVGSLLSNAGSTTLLGTPATGTAGDLTLTTATPFFYLSHAFTDRITAGLGFSTLFGLGTHYPDSWYGRYFALDTDLKTVDLNPNLSYRLLDTLSIGAGFYVRYSRAKVTKALDLGGIGFANGVPGSIPEAQDGIVRLDADEWGAGYKLGLDWHATPALEVGVSFRSGQHSQLDGTAHFTLSPPGQILSRLTGSLVQSSISAKSSDPASAAVAIGYAVTPDLKLLGEIDWVNWKTFNELRVVFANPAQPDSAVTGHWRDTWKIAAGLTYKLLPQIELRAGTAWEESPIPDPAHRTALLPDANRVWLSAGLGWSVTPATQVNLGYAHLFFSDTRVVSSDPASGILRANTSHGHAEIVSLDVITRF